MACQQGHNQTARLLLMANAKTEAKNSVSIEEAEGGERLPLATRQRQLSITVRPDTDEQGSLGRQTLVATLARQCDANPFAERIRFGSIFAWPASSRCRLTSAVVVGAEATGETALKSQLSTLSRRFRRHRAPSSASQPPFGCQWRSLARPPARWPVVATSWAPGRSKQCGRLLANEQAAAAVDRE